MFGSACEGATKLAEHVWPVYPAQRSSLDAKSAPHPMRPAREGLGLVTLTGAIWVEVWRCTSGLWGVQARDNAASCGCCFCWQQATDVGGQDGQEVGFADHLCVGKLSQRPGKAHGVCFSHCFGTQAKPHPQTLTPRWC
jgi:hypothetical protein